MSLDTKLTVYSDDNIKNIEKVPFEEWDFDKYPVLNQSDQDNPLYWLPSSLLIKPTFQSLTNADNYVIYIRGILNSQWKKTYQEYIKDVYFVHVSFNIFNEYLDPQNAENPVQLSSNKLYSFRIDPKEYTLPKIIIRK